MGIRRGTCEHSDLLGFLTRLYLVSITATKEKVSSRKILLHNFVSIKRSDCFEPSFLHL